MNRERDTAEKVPREGRAGPKTQGIAGQSFSSPENKQNGPDTQIREILVRKHFLSQGGWTLLVSKPVSRAEPQIQ